MKELSVSQMEKINGGDWAPLIGCGLLGFINPWMGIACAVGYEIFSS